MQTKAVTKSDDDGKLSRRSLVLVQHLDVLEVVISISQVDLPQSSHTSFEKDIEELSQG